MNLPTAFLTLLLLTTNSQCQYFDVIDIKVVKNGSSVLIEQADSINWAKEVTDVIIEEQKIPRLKTGSFDGLEKLKLIKIQHCNLHEIDRGAFRNLPKLRVLNLSFNNLLERIRNGIFKGLDVTELYLIGNAISIIEENAFTNLKYLEKIDLSRNKINDLDPHMFHGTNYLRKINLSFNYIKTVPNHFFDDAFANVRKDMDSSIDVSDNNIGYFNIKTFKGVYNVKTLDLKNNNLKKLQSNIFDDLEYIGMLNLENNLLRSLKNETLEHLKSADEINLAGNPWTCDFVLTYDDWCGIHNKSNTAMSDFSILEC